jgi:hypothetical protein
MVSKSLSQDLLAIDLLREALDDGRITILNATANGRTASYDYRETKTGDEHHVNCTMPVAEFAREHIG